ncbi:MFS transporter [Amycolatopsis sp. NPDC102389]|uniref:MFS transporter n=1 Tax=Amycolatopsis sp. NPDC102389 TaxID=3363941 RepID=UPI0038013059
MPPRIERPGERLPRVNHAGARSAAGLGLYADKFGRRAALPLSVTLMSFGLLAIALTPGYSSIGILAQVILVVAQLAQGLSVGGEFGSSATYLSEIATPRRRGFYSSFQYVSITAGQLSALLVMIVMQSLLTEAQMYAWGWRIPFVLGAIAGLRRDVPPPRHGGIGTLPTLRGCRLAFPRSCSASPSAACC